MVTLTAACINRIRLEFKGRYFYIIFMRVTVLIESDWNLKQLVSAGLTLVQGY